MADTDALTPAEQAILIDQAPAEVVTPAPVADPTPEPAAEPAKPPEAAPEAKAADTKTVPLAALHEERERRKELQQQVTVQAEKQARLDERFAFIQAQIEKAAKPAPVEETPLDQLARTDKEVAQLRQEREQERQVNEVMNLAQVRTREFAQNTPDYFAAQEHLGTSRKAELAAMGVPAHQIESTLQNEYLQIANMALQQGHNPAKIVYELATHRGYAKKAEAAAPQKTNAELAAEKAATLAKGAAAAGSLSNTGGAPARAGTSLESILTMNEKEIAALDMDKLAAMFGEPRG